MDRLTHRIFQRLWAHYRTQVDQVGLVEDAIRNLDESWIEDHVAFRTLPGTHIGSQVLQGIFECLGYVRKDSYRFEDKSLNAFWMEPKGALSSKVTDCAPKIFMSELDPTPFPVEVKAILTKLANKVESSPLERIKQLSFLALKEQDSEETPHMDELEECVVCYLTRGAPWGALLSSEYDTLCKSSEYAAWTAVFGSSANHFTVSVHLMSRFKSLSDFNKFCLEELEVPMNSNGGVIKGTSEIKLEQCATLAEPVPVLFQDTVRMLPYAFIEFAFRHPYKEKSEFYKDYYQGFVVNNADRIFESTNTKRL